MIEILLQLNVCIIIVVAFSAAEKYGGFSCIRFISVWNCKDKSGIPAIQHFSANTAVPLRIALYCSVCAQKILAYDHKDFGGPPAWACVGMPPG